MPERQALNASSEFPLQGTIPVPPVWFQITLLLWMGDDDSVSSITW
jgi:hypothetical protein